MNQQLSLPQQALREHCCRLWQRVLGELDAGPLAGPLQRLVRRLDSLEQLLPPATEDSAAPARTLLTLARRLHPGDHGELQVQLLSCCMTLAQRRGAARARALQQIQALCREELLAVRATPGTLRATRILAAFATDSCGNDAVSLDESVLAGCLRRLPKAAPAEWIALQALRVQVCLEATQWEPGTTTHRALVRACRQLYALLLLSSSQGPPVQLMQLEIQLQGAHLLRQTPAHAVLMNAHELLWRLRYGVAPGAMAADGPSQGDDASVPAPLVTRIDALYQALTPGTPTLQVSPALLAAAYELAAVATQAELGAASLVLRCTHAALAEHWNHAWPLAPRSGIGAGLQLLRQSSAPQAACLRQALYQLGDVWPQGAIDGAQAIPLADGGGTMRGSVQLQAVPALLSAGLPTLNAAREQWFVDPQGFAGHQLALQGELMLLERGAAAVQVRPVEQLCAYLLELLMALDLPGALARFPGRLLWRAHQHLLQLLDAAAAWWETVPDRELFAELREQSRLLLPTVPEGRVAEPGADEDAPSWLDTRQRLIGYVQSFAGVLDVQVRLDVSGNGEAWPPAQLQRLHAALIPLLRFLLLEFSLSVEQRRARHLPLTGCLWLSLQHDAAGALVAELRDDAVRELPGAVQWQQLRHRMRRSGISEVSCEETPLGRCFTLHLDPADDSPGLPP